MKKLLITLLLISSFSFSLDLSTLLDDTDISSGWGDVFFCEMTSRRTISRGGYLYTYETNKLSKFKFTLDQSLQAMRFGEKGIHDLGGGLVLEGIGPRVSLTGWSARDDQWLITGMFIKGTFYSTRLNVFTEEIDTITADCDKF